MRLGRHRCALRVVAVIGSLLLLMSLGFGSLDAAAESDGSDEDFSSLPKEYGEMLDALPEAIRDSLPQGVFGESAEELSDGLMHFLTPKSLLSYITTLLLGDVTAPLSLLLMICGVLLLSALVNTLSGGLGTGVAPAFGLLCRLCFALILARQTFFLLEEVQEYFEVLRQLTQAYIPVMSAMYLMGGNFATATVNQGAMIFATSIVNVLGGESVIPVVSSCLAMTLPGLLDGGVAARLEFLSGKIKKWYTTALALTMLLLGGGMAAQNTLVARADSLGFRTLRFVVSANIPFVGGGVAEMLRNAASGVTWLRSLVGIGGVVMLLALLLPMVGRVLICRLVCTLGADAASWLGCPTEGKLLSEVGSIYGYLLAVVSLSSITFFFSLLLLLGCSAAMQ